MKILVAEDDRASRRRLEVTLKKWGYEVIATADGKQAWEKYQETEDLPLIVLDLEMPGMDGLDVCRKVRMASESQLPYIIFLSAFESKEDVAEGLLAGADDYVTKPFHPMELRARVKVGVRVIELQQTLENRVKELEDAFDKINELHDILKKR